MTKFDFALLILAASTRKKTTCVISLQFLSMAMSAITRRPNPTQRRWTAQQQEQYPEALNLTKTSRAFPEPYQL